LSRGSVSLTDLVEPNLNRKHERFRDLDLDEYLQAISQPAPYEERDIRSRPEPISLQVTREVGVFALREQILWNVHDKRNRSYVLSRARYRIATDPLAAFSVDRSGIPCFELLKDEPDTPLHYPMKAAQRLTARELSGRGIAPLEEDAGQ
jgi:hypothetical protein